MENFGKMESGDLNKTMWWNKQCDFEDAYQTIKRPDEYKKELEDNENVEKTRSITKSYLIEKFQELGKDRAKIRQFIYKYAHVFWLFDKLGRRVTIDDYIFWYSKVNDTKLTSHLGRISFFNIYTGQATITPIKSKEYLQNWEKAIKAVGTNGNLYESDATIDLKIATQGFGFYLISAEDLVEYPHI